MGFVTLASAVLSRLVRKSAARPTLTFGVLTLTEFRGIQEFGFIAGIAILMAFLQ